MRINRDLPRATKICFSIFTSDTTVHDDTKIDNEKNNDGLNKSETSHADVKFKSPRYKWFGTGAFNIFDQRGLCTFRQEIIIHLNVLKQLSHRN